MIILNFAQAYRWAQRKHGNGMINVYCYTENPNLKIKKFPEMSDEWIEEYDIQKGKFDNITMCKYTAPTATSIGRIYQRLILDNIEEYQNVIEAIRAVFNSFISDEISDFNSNVYYSNPDYLKWSYKEGRLLD